MFATINHTFLINGGHSVRFLKQIWKIYLSSNRISGVLWHKSRLFSAENSNFPCFSVSSTFQHEIRC